MSCRTGRSSRGRKRCRAEAVLGRGPACATSGAMREPRSRGEQAGLERDGWWFLRHGKGSGGPSWQFE